jgi:Kinetochore protein CHL4 like
MPPKKENTASPTDTLSSTTLIPNSALLRRFLTRLPKTVTIDLVLIWLDHPLCPIHQPLDDEDDDFYGQEDETLDDKKALYEVYRDDTSITKKVVIDRILGIDWVYPGVCD